MGLPHNVGYFASKVAYNDHITCIYGTLAKCSNLYLYLRILSLVKINTYYLILPDRLQVVEQVKL